MNKRKKGKTIEVQVDFSCLTCRENAIEFEEMIRAFVKAPKNAPGRITLTFTEDINVFGVRLGWHIGRPR